MGSLSEEERPIIGQLANEIRGLIESEIKDFKEKISSHVSEEKIKAETIDITMPGRVPEIGRRHPLMHVKEELETLFMNMGYDVVDGPEIDTVENNLML